MFAMRIIRIGIVAAFIVAAVAAASHSQAVEAKPGPGREVLLRLCAECHGIEDVIASRRSTEQWRSVIDKMLDKGASGSDEEIATVLKYLTTAYGRVNVNKAPAAEIAQVLAIPQEQADAIVKLRTDNGPFADFDALAKVSGLDVEKLTKQRDAISF